MARDLSCPSGKPCYKTKREAEGAHPEIPVMRCHRCRWWHPSSKKRKAKRDRGHRG